MTVHPFRLLASYYYYRTVDLDALAQAMEIPDLRVMADSGGFSAFTQGKDVSLEGYAAWLARWMHRMDGYANLDVIGDPQATRVNQQRLEALGLSPLPIFHYGEPWSYLEAYLRDYPYIMLGGLAGVKERPWSVAAPWLIRCFQMGEGRATYHGLGVSSKVILQSLPFYSADASSWLSAAQYRTACLWDDHARSWATIPLNDAVAVRRHLRLLHSYAITAQDVHSWVGQGGGSVTQTLWEIGAAAWMRYTTYLRRLHGLIPLAGRDDGLIYYLAGNAANMKAMNMPRTIMRAEGVVYA